MSSATLRNNAAEHRYELLQDGQVVAFTVYELAGDAIRLTHTEVVAGNEGKGFGSALARQALDMVRAQNKKLIPVCEFIAGYVQKHPEYRSLIQADH